MLQLQGAGGSDWSGHPGLLDAIEFRCKATVRQLQRSCTNAWKPSVQAYAPSETLVDAGVIAESITPLWMSIAAAERNLIVGKIRNLRLAAQQIHGIELPAGACFSFWAQVGQPTRQRGYVAGRELRQGCVIPNIGGGLCQLSNALYSAALDAGLTIVERHAHTKVIPGSLAEIGRDATVFWNYVDLRFQTPTPLRIEVSLTDEHLIVRFRGYQSFLTRSSAELDSSQPRAFAATHSCLTCGVSACWRNEQAGRSSGQLPERGTVYLLDDYWPEFDQYLQSKRRSNDILAVPLDGQRWRQANYAWSLENAGTVHQAAPVTLRRSLSSRRLAAQGAARQTNLLRMDAQLARWYADRVADMSHWVVMQNLLPFLWQNGDLAGRTFDVLMTRLPLSMLHDRLDVAAQQHPESSTLSDFRADRSLVIAETEALQAARSILTPHAEIVQEFGQRAIQLPWHLPAVECPPRAGQRVLFPAATVARKGAYELRETARSLALELNLLGPQLEGNGFWDGVPVQRVTSDPLAGVGLVVLPAYVEHQPRLLLRAIAAGIPVIASEPCGLGNQKGVVTIPAGNSALLQQAIAAFVTGQR
jgi:hypothetical protein